MPQSKAQSKAPSSSRVTDRTPARKADPDAVVDLAARVMGMPVDRLTGESSLSSLGMDSLMAIEFRATVERETGVSLPVGLLAEKPSLAEIASFIDDLRGPESDHGVAQVDSTECAVPLKESGQNAPLFFVPAGEGDLLAFKDIADHLGAEQPSFGFKPPPAAWPSIHRLVTAYANDIQVLQPKGPYRIAGYSAGAIIAMELARELTRRGEDVCFLGILDAPSRVPAWLDRFYSVTHSLASKTRLLGLVRRLRSRWLRRVFHATLDDGLRVHTAVTRGHRLRRYAGALTYFRAKSSWVSRFGAERAWGQIASDDIEVRLVPGTHYGMLRGMPGEALADELKDCLARTEAVCREC